MICCRCPLSIQVHPSPTYAAAHKDAHLKTECWYILATSSVNGQQPVIFKGTARVLEVKPNGTLLLEARRSIKTDREEALVVISGICRPDDVTVSNTVQSNQMYDMRLDVQNTGDVKNTADKGLITRILEGMFNF